MDKGVCLITHLPPLGNVIKISFASLIAGGHGLPHSFHLVFSLFNLILRAAPSEGASCPSKTCSEAVGLTTSAASGAQHPCCAPGQGREWGGREAAMEGKHNTNHTIVRGWGRWDNAVRRDEKNDSPFSIVVISKDEPTAPAREGMGLYCSQMLLFPVLPSIISGEKGWGVA